MSPDRGGSGNPDRRTFLAAGLAAGLSSFAPGRPASAASAASGRTSPSPGRRSPAYHPLGIQLYTLRSILAEELEGTLRRVAAMGYREVELAGTYGLDAGEMRGLLDRVGLRATSSHLGLDVIRGGWEAALDDAATLGQDGVVCPWTPVDERTADGYRRIADEFNRAAEAARAAGLGFAYHNHAFEFEAVDGERTGYDILVERCDPDLVKMQMDVFWATEGSQDVLEWFRAWPGRFTSIHAKDRTPEGSMVAVGRGAIDFAAILDAGEMAGIEHVFVEHDQPEDPLAVARESYLTLAKLEV